MVYWFTGLSGAGKTTLGWLFFQHVKSFKENVVFLDGDVLRNIFGGMQGYSIEERKLLAMRYSRLCKMLSDQGLDVVCATISMFHEIRDWNRENIDGYLEVYVKVPIEILIKRDQKQLYSRALRGEVDNVLGLDVECEVPSHPDITIINDGRLPPDKVIEQFIKELSGILDGA